MKKNRKKWQKNWFKLILQSPIKSKANTRHQQDQTMVLFGQKQANFLYSKSSAIELSALLLWFKLNQK